MYKPIKSLGQNFLTDKNIVRLMVDSLELRSGDTVIEIGPGHGVLTEELSEALPNKDSHIFAVDIDERFTAKLEEMFLSKENVTIVNDDVLKFLPQFDSQTDFKILGSLPYYITSPIIHEIVQMKKQPKTCVLLIQKEVAEKIAADAPNSSYMSVFVQTFYNVTYLETILREKFIPEPKVDGGIIKLALKTNPIVMDEITLTKFSGFLHKGFSSPRKMLNKPFTKEELALANIDPKKRPQELSADEWLNFFYLISGK